MTRNEIWVYVETENGSAKSVGYELLNAAKPIAYAKHAPLVAVVVGKNVRKAAEDAIGYGADSAIILDGDEYAVYSTDAYTDALTELIRKYEPETLMLGATVNGRDMAPRIACRLETGLTADCTDIGIDEGTGCVRWTRPTFGGNLMADIICPDKRPQMGTVRPGVFRKAAFDAGRTGKIIEEDIHVSMQKIRTSVVKHIEEIAENVDLEGAEIIVAGGRGMGNAENFRILEALADAVGGTVACSRPCADAGWLPRSRQIGQSGKTVSPKIYFAVGISGAVQHTAGMQGSGTIIAINNDPEAPIFDIADYRIVGDLNTIVPVLTKKFLEFKKD
ncbi:MAG: electron transfer flavoprotein subunit alpha/FixB family protein [Lachnospiraceae bacterium]|nr:electron transfer flavoprotein subunit alpha/FixB family protein [Lachnospiraceae bacterium]